MENQAADQQSYEDVQKSGYLRKQKSMHRRFFVLRAASEQGPSRLEYYENEKKFRSKSPVPKKALNLETCFNINKRADSKNKHMIVLYTRGESFAIAADNEEVQNEWYQAMLDLQSKCKSPEEGGSGGECDIPSPGSAFKEVWQVKVWPKGLGQARNLVGIYRLCLTDKTVNFVKLNSDVASVVLQLMNVRRCGHSENFFFIEVGRSAMTGPGEFWMQVDDSVVAQHMHETLLEAMKALSEEFRQRSKSQSVGASCGGTASNPISVPSRRHNPNLPPSQVGFSRRARTETPGAGGGSSTSTSPTSRHGFPRARTASIGGRSEEGGAGARGTWASSSPSLNGSCSTTPTLRTKPTRAPTPAKITLSLARYTPNPAPSPVPSLSSSSGHGSEYGLVGGAVGGVAVCSFTRIPQRVSVSCSPSDYGSSDEYGSSPGEHSLAVPSLHGGSNGGLGLHAHGEGSSSYIIMGQREALPGSHQRHHGRRVLRRSSSRECEAERRLLSKRASLPLASHERLAPHRKEGEDEHEEEYAVMSRSKCREPFVPHQGPVGLTAVGGGHQHESGERADTAKGEAGGRQLVDSGYMSMLPGVTAPPALLSLSVAASEGGVKPGADDEYMAMTPNNSVSPPQHMGLPASEGYMVMSPSSSCSPDLHGVAMWESRASVESRAGSDYMNMSPISVCSACSTPPSHPEQHSLQPKSVHSYFSLPRSYQHTLSTRFEDDLGPEKGKSSGADQKRGGHRGGRVSHRKRDVIPSDSRCCPLSLSSSSFSSSSASSESLDDKSMSVATGRGLPLSRMGAGHRNTGTRMKDGRHQLKHTSSCKGPHQPRKGMGASSDMTKANTLPKVKESLLPAVPPSPGEYVSILYRGGAEAGSGGPWGPEPSLSLTRSFPKASPAPALCQDDGSNNLPRSFSAPLSTSAEYVTMDLGSVHHRPVQPSFSKPQGPPPAISPKARAEHNRPSPGAAEGHSRCRTNSTMAEGQGERLTSFTDYTDMGFRRGLDSHPQCPNYTARTGTHKNPTSSMAHEGGSSFTPVKSFSSPDRTSRTRGDAGRRRHRSETFKTQPALPLQSSVASSIFLEGSQAGNRRHGLDASPRDDGPTSMSPRRVAQTNCSAATEQGLNYIDLDLDRKDNPQAGLEGPVAGHSLFTPGHGGESAGGNLGFNLNTYARIDFYKSEELRAQHTNRTDDSDC